MVAVLRGCYGTVLLLEGVLIVALPVEDGYHDVAKTMANAISAFGHCSSKDVECSSMTCMVLPLVVSHWEPVLIQLEGAKMKNVENPWQEWDGTTSGHFQ